MTPRIPDALYVPDGDRFVPTELCRGPWSPDAQHGGPPAALLVRAMERTAGDDGMQMARLTVDLLRPVPLAPLVVAARVTRPGRNVRLLEASLSAAGAEIVRAAMLRIRLGDLPVPPGIDARPASPPGPDAGRTSVPPWALPDAPAYHSHGVEHRFVAGGFDRPGPATDWLRLRVPLVAGEPTAPAARVAAVADFGNGVSWVLSRIEGWRFINPDLTIHLHRLPAGEWVCLEAATWVESNGIALAESRLHDERGMIGRALQSLLLDRG